MSTDSIPRPAKLAHFVLRTARFDEVIQWWSTVLGAHVVHSNDFLAFLTYDDEHHRLAVVKSELAGDEGRRHAGLEHVAFTMASLDDLVSTYERLRDQDIVPVLPINHGMTLSMYYADPDGTQCELQVDLCTPEEADRFMSGPEFAANPLGIVFDPEELVAQHRSGGPVGILRSFGPLAVG